RRLEIAAFERLLGRLQTVRRCPRALPTTREMLCQQLWIPLSGPLQPLAREPVTEGPIVAGQHRVRPFPQEDVPEGELHFAGESAPGRAHERLALGGAEQTPLYRGRGVRAAEERRHAARPEHLTKDRSCPERPPVVVVERREPRLHHRDDRLR